MGDQQHIAVRPIHTQPPSTTSLPSSTGQPALPPRESNPSHGPPRDAKATVRVPCIPSHGTRTAVPPRTPASRPPSPPTVDRTTKCSHHRLPCNKAKHIGPSNDLGFYRLTRAKRDFLCKSANSQISVLVLTLRKHLSLRVCPERHLTDNRLLFHKYAHAPQLSLLPDELACTHTDRKP